MWMRAVSVTFAASPCLLSRKVPSLCRLPAGTPSLRKLPSRNHPSRAFGGLSLPGPPEAES
jgi:hypothetical protein